MEQACIPTFIRQTAEKVLSDEIAKLEEDMERFVGRASIAGAIYADLSDAQVALDWIKKQPACS